MLYDEMDNFAIFLTAQIMTTGLAGGLFCGYKPLFPACV